MNDWLHDANASRHVTKRHIATKTHSDSDDSVAYFGQFCWTGAGGSMSGSIVSSSTEEVCQHHIFHIPSESILPRRDPSPRRLFVFCCATALTRPTSGSGNFSLDVAMYGERGA